MIKFGNHGPAVGALHQSLVEAGETIDPAELTVPTFGRSTEAAVMAYQRAHGLPADGIVGPRTLAALHGSIDYLFTAPGWRWDSTAIRPEIVPVIQHAIGHIGTREVPPGSNRGPKIDDWLRAAGLHPGDPWCAAFATVMWAHGPEGSPFGHALGSAYKIRQWALAHDRLVALPAPGDVWLIMRDEFRGHAGLVAGVRGDGVICTVEGNAGDAVRGLLRERAGMTAIVRPV